MRRLTAHTFGIAIALPAAFAAPCPSGAQDVSSLPEELPELKAARGDIELDDAESTVEIIRITERSDHSKAHLARVLTTTPVTINVDEQPARQAFNLLRDQLPVPLVGLYADDSLGYGIDPDRPLTISAEEVPALDVLEKMLDQCSRPNQECTWQIRHGFIEFGTKQRLSVPASRERRTYFIGDLMLPFDESGDRRLKETAALDSVQEIVETIEPGSWDWGQIDYDEEDDAAGSRQSRPTGAAPIPPSNPPAGGGASGAPASAAAEAAGSPVRYVMPLKPASIRVWRQLLIIDAPDYIHRQIAGYPEEEPASARTRAARERVREPEGREPEG